MCKFSRIFLFRGALIALFLSAFAPTSIASDGEALLDSLRYSGQSVVGGENVGVCTLEITRDDQGNIQHISVSGTAKRVTYGNASDSGPTPTQIAVGEVVSAEEVHSFTNFTAMPSLAHPGYKRIGLQINTGTLEHPWPGFQEVRYVVAKDKYASIIARTNIYLMIRMIPLGYDEIRCVEMQEIQ